MFRVKFDKMLRGAFEEFEEEFEKSRNELLDAQKAENTSDKIEKLKVNVDNFGRLYDSVHEAFLDWFEEFPVDMHDDIVKRIKALTNEIIKSINDNKLLAGFPGHLQTKRNVGRLLMPLK